MKFERRQPRISELRNSIHEYSHRLKVEQNDHDEIKSEALSYVGKLQLCSAMLATPDKMGVNEEKSKRFKKNPLENEVVSPYLQQTDTVSS
jgi:hypothetical protein